MFKFVQRFLTRQTAHHCPRHPEMELDQENAGDGIWRSFCPVCRVTDYLAVNLIIEPLPASHTTSLPITEPISTPVQPVLPTSDWLNSQPVGAREVARKRAEKKALERVKLARLVSPADSFLNDPSGEMPTLIMPGLRRGKLPDAG